MSVKRSNFTLFFFKAACDAKPGAMKKQGGSSSYVSRNIVQSFQINDLTVMLCFEHTNHDILLYFLF